MLRILALLGALIGSHLAFAQPVFIREDRGGSVDAYNVRLEKYARNNTRVVLDGVCMSACARFMTLPNVCATPRAYFYFHGITVDGELDIDAGVRDSRRFETAKAFALEARYNAFAMGYAPLGPPTITPLASGIDRVSLPSSIGRNQIFLRVKATKLVPAC